MTQKSLMQKHIQWHKQQAEGIRSSENVLKPNTPRKVSFQQDKVPIIVCRTH